MNAQYQKVFGFVPEKQFPGCPVQILKGAILWDSVRKLSVVQMKFRNAAPKNLRTLYVKLFLYDHNGESVNVNEEGNVVAYSDVNAGSGTAFGDDRPVFVRSDTIRSFEAYVTRII